MSLSALPGSHSPAGSRAMVPSPIPRCWLCAALAEHAVSFCHPLEAGRLGVICQHINNMNLLIRSES